MNRSEYYKLWATPKASDAITGTTARTSGRAPEKTTHLAAQVHLYPTPRAADGEKGQRTRQGAEKEANRGHGIDLPLFVQLFPTPTAHGNHNRKGSSATSGDGLSTAVKQTLPIPIVNDSKNNGSPSRFNRRAAAPDAMAGGSLNPAWVEWLMGFPIGWTDIDAEIPARRIDPTDLEWWIVEPDIPRVAKGIPNRVARLRALGNAVVPMQAFPIFRSIAETEACS
jgi:DNA (cytosine-5)-methyltransferase 1